MPFLFRTIPLYFFVFATGAAGLIYEVTWQKYLSRLLGSDSMATAIILGTFLGGLSLGYYLCGKFSIHIKNHFKAYAWMECIIGAWCLCFPSIFDAVESISQYWSFLPPVMMIIQGLFCSMLLMGIPTMCMGSTIPFLTRGISLNVEEATRVHSIVYAVNTAGAFLGTLVAGFYLIPEYGLPLTVMGTAVLNLGAFVFFYFQSTNEETEALQVYEKEAAEKPVRHEEKVKAGSSVYPQGILCLVAFISGFYVMTLENILIRITNLSLGSSSYSFSLIVSVFIFSIAVGSWVLGRFKHISSYFLFVNQFLITLFMLVIYSTLDTWPYWAHVIRIMFQPNMAGFYGYYIAVFLTLISVLLLPVGLMGATVPIVFHEIKRDLKNVGKHSGIVFSLNTIGNLAGSLVGGIVLYYFFNNGGIFLTAILITALSTCVVGWYLPKKFFLSGVFVVLSVMVFTFFPLYNGKNFILSPFVHQNFLPYSLEGPQQFFNNFFNGMKVLFCIDGPVASVSVIDVGSSPAHKSGSIAIVINGKPDSTTKADDDTLKLCAHLPALLAKEKKDVMLIGLGTGVTAGELTLYPDIEHIDIAEISPSVVKALPYFSEHTNNVHEDPRVSIHQGDAFRILKRSRKKWNIIISEPSNPWVMGIDQLFTQEFYKLAKEKLAADGILLQWIHVYSADINMLGMVLNTVQNEFKYVRAFMANQGDLQIFASDKLFSVDDIARAEKTLGKNKRVKKSLKEINIESFDAILIREIFSPTYINEKFSKYGLQTMDNPRLHYMAGKSYFLGKSVSSGIIFSPDTAFYADDYLISKKYNDWANLAFTKDTMNSLLDSSKDIFSNEYLPMANAIMLKAYLGNPDMYRISLERAKIFRTDIISFIVDYPENEERWNEIHLKGAPFREKAQVLLDHVDRTRNWIVPYDVDGLKRLLVEGASNGKDVYEKNWCALQAIKLLIYEKADNTSINTVYNQMEKGEEGNIKIYKKDEALLREVDQLMKNDKK